MIVNYVIDNTSSGLSISDSAGVTISSSSGSVKMDSTGSFTVNGGANQRLIIDAAGTNPYFVLSNSPGSVFQILTGPTLTERFNVYGDGTVKLFGDIIGGGATIGAFLIAGNNLQDLALTSGRVTYAGASGLLTDSANLTFNGTTFNVNAVLNLNNNVINNLAAPVLGTDAVNKSYADSLKNGIQWKQSVRLSTAAVLAAYTPAGSGIGKTLTANANGALSIDGVAVAVNDRVLIKNETAGNAFNNGIYTVTQTGDATHPFIITRATDADENSEVMSGMAMFIDAGTVNADSGYLLTTADPIVVDTTSLAFTRFSSISARTPVASDGITIVNDPFSATISARADTIGSVQSIVVNSGASPSGIAVKFDPAGALSATASGTKVNVDNSTISISGDAIYVPNGGITDTQLAAIYIKANGSVGLSADWNAGSPKITAGNFTDTSLTSGRVIYAGISGLLQDSANLTFDNTTMTVNNEHVIYSVGIGVAPDTANPVNVPLNVQNSSLNFTTGSQAGIAYSGANYPTSPSSAIFRGYSANVTWGGDQDNTGRITGAEFRCAVQGSANIGVGSSPIVGGGGAVGIFPWILHEGTGTIGQAIGVQTQIFNQGGGTINQAIGVCSQIVNEGTPSITIDAFGVYVATPAILSGSITNNYGIYLNNQTGATGLNYSIYSVGGANYFGGGVTTPSLTDSGLTSGRVTFASTGGLLSDSADLAFVRSHDQSTPVHKGSLSNGVGGAIFGKPASVFVSSNYAYVVSFQANALEIVDVSDPANPVHRGSLTNGTGGALLNGCLGVFVSGNYAYVAPYNSNALEIVDISNPVNPIHKGSLTSGTGGALLNGAYGVFVVGNYAYVASSGSDALEIVDVSDPANPVHKGSLTNGTGGALLGFPSNVFVSGNYAYVTSVNSNALEIVDVSDPANPVHKGSLTNGTGGAILNGAYGIFVVGNYAYVTSFDGNALEIVDVSDPANPVHKGSLTNGTGGALLDQAQDIFVSGNYAYIASYGSNALEIVDVSDPANPVHRGSLTNGTGGAILNGAVGVFVVGNHAYVTSYLSHALEIIEIFSSASLFVNGYLDGTSYISVDLVHPHTTNATILSKTDGGVSLASSDGTVGLIEKVIHANTTDATPTALTFNGAAAGAGNIPSLSTSTTHGYVVNVTGRDTTNGLTVAFIVVRAVLERSSGGTVSLLASANDELYKSNVSISVVAAADDTNKGLNIQVTGLASTDITWKGYVVETAI